MRLKIQVVLGETEENYEFPHNQRYNILHLTQSLFINIISYMFRLTCSHSRADIKKDKSVQLATVEIFLLLFILFISEISLVNRMDHLQNSLNQKNWSSERVLKFGFPSWKP